MLSSCVSNKQLTQYALAPTAYDSVYVVTMEDSLRSLNTGDFLTRNPEGNWELFVSGSPFELGNKSGLLTEDLFRFQQKVFMDKLETLVPSKFKRKMVSRFLNWYGRRLDRHIPEEYLTEIYALSQYLDGRYSYAGDDYNLTLFMHAAHDLGHALRDLAVVGCSSTASWGDNTEDGKLLIGRNFDFYVGDDFAQNKMVSFVRPTSGIPFMSVSWAGMVGVVSGMNLEGLTVTMNAGKSSIPLSAKKPISIVAREILEKANTIDEAITIAKSSQVFVSESLMIGSAKDKKAVLIELSPKRFDVYEVENQEQLVCTNHFQSSAYADDKRNQQHILDSHSQYRYERLTELLEEQPVLNPTRLAAILRNKEGLENRDIGLGNDKSLAHLLAHHAIIFKPEERLVWVSNSPYQLGAFTAYDLNEIFADHIPTDRKLSVDSLLIPEDSFLHSERYADYEAYRTAYHRTEQAIQEDTALDPEEIQNFVDLNPNLWLVYYLSGKYWYHQQEYERASGAWEQALEMVIPTRQSEQEIKKWLKKADKKWKK